MVVIQLSITRSQFLSIVYFSLPYRVDDVQMIVLPALALTNYIFPGPSVLLMLSLMLIGNSRATCEGTRLHKKVMQ